MSTTSEDSSPVERNMIYNELYSQHFADTPIAASRPNSTQTPTTPNNSPASPINIQLNRSSIQENTFNSVKWSESIKEVPDFIKSMGVYPISTVFATCFQEELDDLNNTWRDENGELLDTEDVQELEKVLKRIDLLENSIEFLKRCVPPGR
ncbi:hypothetical protein HK103_003012 [Boothiomyces macroporosus]|uniref:Uncharacterized protein n=1 Tax=Boothiomyces macroporosus TaxID=261099 RepID=A0AAD5UIL7_9FUNG|nr:hypothetical protein HK103_003012 [Boothiomyces macroporosus]